MLQYDQELWAKVIWHLEWMSLHIYWGYEDSQPDFERAQQDAMQFNPIAAYLISRYEYELIERVKRRVLK